MNDFDEITIIPKPSAEHLNPRQLKDYCLERKNPDKYVGYALSSSRKPIEVIHI